jgi:hypothetical protein
MISIVCRQCGGTFMVRPYRKHSATFCSRRCGALGTVSKREPHRLKAIRGKIAHNNQGMTKSCLQCSKIFRLSPSRLESKHYCSQNCYTQAQKSNPLPLKRYKRVTVDGIRVLEHRHVMEKQLGRKLLTHEQVHHKDRDRHNNDPANLEVLDIVEHGRISASHRGPLLRA